MTDRKKEYLGDSVYAADNGRWGIVLTTENGKPHDPSNTIYLEPQALDALIRFARSLGWAVGGEEGK